jgi:hypothetical protein
LGHWMAHFDFYIGDINGKIRVDLYT